MPGIAVIKCHFCGREGPLVRGSEKAILAWLREAGWKPTKKYGTICKACVRGLKEGESDLERCERKTRRMSSESTAQRSAAKKGRRPPRAEVLDVEVLTETHLPAKFHTGQRVEWDAREYGLGRRGAEVIGVRDKLGHYRYKIRLDATVKRRLKSGRLAEVDVPETALRHESPRGR